jgi:hypothetical protein
MKLACAATLAVLMLPTLCWSQTPAAPSPERLQLARRIIEAQGGLVNMAAMTRNMSQGLLASVGQGLPSEQRQALQESIEEANTDLLPRMLGVSERIYATEFDEKQLSDMLAFYNSPTGKTLTARLPQIGQEIGIAVAQMMPALQLKMLVRLCEKTDCPAALRQRIGTLRQSIPVEQRF